MKYYLKGAFLLLFALGTLFLGGDLLRAPASSDQPNKEEEREATKYVPYDLDLSEYLTMGDLSAVQAEFDDPSVCTESEIDEAIFQILLTRAQFEEVPPAQKAELYNRVTVNLAVMQNGQVLADYSKIDYQVVIGLETENGEDLALSGALMGAVVGESRSVEYTYPDEVIGTELAGQTVVLYTEVKKVERQLIPQLIDATVAEISGDTFSTVQEFRAAIRQDILAEKELAKAQAVWLAVKRDAHVRRFPQRELQDAVTSFRNYYQALAAQYEISLEQLVTVYMEQTMEEFEADAKAYAEEMVTNEMIFLQLIRLQGITLTDEEYLAGAEEYYAQEESSFASFEEYVEYYTEETLRQELLKDKALKAVVDRAVRIG